VSTPPLLVILDLDHTLIYSNYVKPNPRAKPIPPVKEVHFSNREFKTQIRPGAEQFLQKLFSDKRFRSSVWTTGSSDYAEYIMTNLKMPLKELYFVRSEKHCTQAEVKGVDGRSSFGQTRYLKDLRKAIKHHPWPLERIIAIDDDRSIYSRQYSNQLVVPRFEGEETSPNVFETLWKYLEYLSTIENIRPIEKRNWMGKKSEYNVDDRSFGF
jgi:TFIIF-interacting CTD phosphatase-like protein